MIRKTDWDIAHRSLNFYKAKKCENFPRFSTPSHFWVVPVPKHGKSKTCSGSAGDCFKYRHRHLPAHFPLIFTADGNKTVRNLSSLFPYRERCYQTQQHIGNLKQNCGAYMTGWACVPRTSYISGNTTLRFIRRKPPPWKMVEINGAYYPPFEQHPCRKYFRGWVLDRTWKNYLDLSPPAP